jgi:superfamily II DNA or RNA helicase
MANLRSLVASACQADSLRGAAAAVIDLFAYQLEPALACARGATRLLLADEVGLGKTVQAGLILADLRARDESVRALVLCPAGLCGQWLHELEDRFHLAAEVVDRAAVGRRQASSVAIGPWEQVPIAVASVDFVKRPEVLLGMEAVRWDLLVVDEAHLCAQAPERAAAVNWLARRARRVVLATATPHPGEPGAFEALCRVGRLPGEGPILMFRRTRADIGLAANRHCRILAVRLSGPERRLHRQLERYTSLVWRTASAGQSNAGARLAVIVLRKRAASGVASLLASLMRRLRWIGSPADAASEQLLLPFEDASSEASDEEPGLVLATPGLADGRVERVMLTQLIDLARAAIEHDSKCRALARYLRRSREPAIVFTEYRDTLTSLAEAYGERAGIATIHGGMDRAARADAVRAFNRGTAHLLLATDAAAHGLNLQARCRLVISLELPWNPVRLEQRIGRVDRIGQQRTVHAVHLVARRTGEERVLARLARKVMRAGRVLGPSGSPLGPASEADTAEALFASGRGAPPSAIADEREPASAAPSMEPAAIDDLVVRHGLSVEAREETARLERIRVLTARPGIAEGMGTAVLGSGPCWTTLRLRGWSGDAWPMGKRLSFGSILAVFAAEITDGRGLVVDLAISVLASEAATPPPGRPGEVAAMLGPGTSLRVALDTEARRQTERRLAGVREVLLPQLEALGRRELAMAAANDRVPVAACQPGLFDRRALRQADERQRARRAREIEDEAQMAALSRAAIVQLAGPPRLVLVALLRP